MDIWNRKGIFCNTVAFIISLSVSVFPCIFRIVLVVVDAV